MSGRRGKGRRRGRRGRSGMRWMGWGGGGRVGGGRVVSVIFCLKGETASGIGLGRGFRRVDFRSVNSPGGLRGPGLFLNRGGGARYLI